MTALLAAAGIGPVVASETVALADPTTLMAMYPAELAMLVHRIQAVSEQRLRVLGLSCARARALMRIREHGHLIQTELAGLLGIENPAVVKLLDKLEQQGLVERQPMSGDRRANQVQLTAAGHRLMEQLDQLLQRARDAIMAGVDDAELAAGRRLLRRLERNLQTMTGSAGTKRGGSRTGSLRVA